MIRFDPHYFFLVGCKKTSGDGDSIGCPMVISCWNYQVFRVVRMAQKMEMDGDAHSVVRCVRLNVWTGLHDVD